MKNKNVFFFFPLPITKIGWINKWLNLNFSILCYQENYINVVFWLVKRLLISSNVYSKYLESRLRKFQHWWILDSNCISKCVDFLGTYEKEDICLICGFIRYRKDFFFQTNYSFIHHHQSLIASVHFPTYIWVESERCIHSCTACHEQVDLREPNPLQIKLQLMSSDLNALLGHGHITIYSIRRFLLLTS